MSLDVRFIERIMAELFVSSKTRKELVTSLPKKIHFIQPLTCNPQPCIQTEIRKYKKNRKSGNKKGGKRIRDQQALQLRCYENGSHSWAALKQGQGSIWWYEKGKGGQGDGKYNPIILWGYISCFYLIYMGLYCTFSDFTFGPLGV